MEFQWNGGDWALDERGMPLLLEGRRALAEQIRHRLQIPKGSYVLCPSLGSRLHLLREGCPGDLEPQALQFAQEALADLPGVLVNAAELQGNPPQRVQITLDLLGEREEVEVVL